MNLRPDQVAERLGVGKRSVYRLIASGDLPAVQGKDCLRVNEDSLPAEKLVRPSRAAQILAVHRSTIYKWVWEGRLTGYKFPSGALRISISSIQKLLEESRL